MTDKSNPSFQKARDEALRALVSNGGLTPDQISGLKLDQVHLATNSLTIEPDEFEAAAADQPPTRLKLDETLQRALIAWLVVRPDGPNDHLFPGEGTAGLDVSTIREAAVAAKPVETAQATKSPPSSAPPPPEKEKLRGIPPEPITRRPTEVKQEPPAPPPPPSHGPEPQAVPLDEIEALRRQLTRAYDDWAPAVPSSQPKPAASPGPERAAPQPEETLEPAEASSLPSEETLVAPLSQEPAIMMPPRPKKAPAARALRQPPREPRMTGEAVPGASPLGDTGDTFRRLWDSSAQKLTLNLSYRAVAGGGLALLLLICCVGLAFVGGTVLSGGGLAGLVAGAPATETPAATQMASAATSIPSPTPTATPSPTPTPSPTFTASPSPTPTLSPTLGPTPTPVIVVITATPTPEPPPTATRALTNTPQGSAPPPAPPTATPAPAFKYPAPVLLEPADGVKVPGIINILKWQPVGMLADDEWYAVRMIFNQQGQPVYEGDRVKVPEFRVPDRLYYQADGPLLQYRWFVFVERDNPDGSTTQLSPESKTFAFRWE